MIEWLKFEISKLFCTPTRSWTLDLPHGTNTFNTEPTASTRFAIPSYEQRQRGAFSVRRQLFHIANYPRAHSAPHRVSPSMCNTCLPLFISSCPCYQRNRHITSERLTGQPKATKTGLGDVNAFDEPLHYFKVLEPVWKVVRAYLSSVTTPIMRTTNDS